MGHRIERPATAFSLDRTKRQRAPRDKNDTHLAFIRRLPCCIPGCRKRDSHAAHIRMAAPELGKRSVGIAEKPDDKWTVPLCGDHHVFGPDAQHNDGDELRWWGKIGIGPFALALALFAISGDDETGEKIIAATKARAKA